MDYEELILERQELDYEDPAPDHVEIKYFCIEDYNYHNCDECKKPCKRNVRKILEGLSNGNNH